MATFEKRVSYSGSKNIETLNGSITLDTARGRLVVRDSHKQERTVIDILGLTTSDPDGTQRLRAGIASSDGRTISIITKTGEDLRSLGI